MSDSFADYDHFIHHEMLVHPALFTHRQASHVAIIDSIDAGIVNEVLKHPSVKSLCQVTLTKPAQTTNDPRLTAYLGKTSEWLTKVTPESIDVIIIPEKTADLSPGIHQQYLNALHNHGILIQQSDSPFHLQSLKVLHQAMLSAGFADTQILHFPQPNSPAGWRTAIMGIKQGMFHRPREKDVFNKPFATRYYNFDIHKAAFVLPEFMREALAL